MGGGRRAEGRNVAAQLRCSLNLRSPHPPYCPFSWPQVISLLQPPPEVVELFDDILLLVGWAGWGTAERRKGL